MEIGWVNRVSMGVPVVAEAVKDGLGSMTQLVAAIRWLNGTQFLSRGREFTLRRRAAGKPPIVDLIDLETGEVLDELPAEEIFRMMADLSRNQERPL
jgi:hypothetical protein